ncbi:MAG: DNA helicase [Nitrospinaceae bacterium]|nr:MAG: DNA helicase [Nitrospinaceae bacterium]
MELSEEEKKLIAEEESLFSKTIESLCGELPQVQASKISANQVARELTQQLVGEWNHEERQPLVSDEAVAHRVSDIRKNSDQTLLELIREPYFGRVVTSEEDGKEVAFLIGKKSNIQSGIVDWRNGPISALYFNYQQGEEFFEEINERERSGRIKLRRSYRIEAGKLVQIDTPEGVYHWSDQGWQKLDVDAEIAAHKSRSVGSQDKRLPNILSLITKDQFELITSHPDRPVIIQGSAGSGKTTVAFHRLAWLLHEENSFARPEKTRVLVMNKSLQIYVDSTLPSLGIHGVETSTFNSWALSIIRKLTRGKAFFKFHQLPDFVEKIKFSEEILSAISGQVKKQTQRTDQWVRDTFSRWPNLIRKWNDDKEKAVLPRIRNFQHEVNGAKLPDKEKKTLMVSLRSLLGKMEDYINDIYDLLADSDHLRQHLKPDAKLDYHLEYLRNRTQKNRRHNNLDYFDMSLILCNIQQKNGGLPDKNGEIISLDHLVIDEAQDFGPVEFAIMVQAVQDRRHITIVGDVSQKILFARRFIGWDKIIDSLGLEESDLIRLEVSFRCTAQIMTLATRVAGDYKAVEGRQGPQPLFQKVADRDDLLETIANWVETVQASGPNKLIALICRNPKQAMELKEDIDEMIPGGVRLGLRDKFSFEPGIIATNVHQVKGLEFDAVCIVEPSEENYPLTRPESRNMLYVAITRAEDELMLVGTKNFSKVLDG